MRRGSSIDAALGSVPVAGQEPAFGGLDRLYLFVVALLPWLPRPTFDGPTSMLAPAAMVGLGLLYVFWAARDGHLRRSAGVRADLLILWMVAFVCAYAIQIVLAGRTAEMEHLFSRVLFFVGILVTVEWLSHRDVTVRQVYGAVLVGFVSLSGLIIFQGVTGLGLFERIGAVGRFGDQFPFFRNSGVPRSFGELGIIASAAWAYLLTHGRFLHRVLHIALSGVVVLAVLITQSRTLWAAVALVTLSYLLLRTNFRTGAAQLLAILALLAPIAVELALPLLESSPATAVIVGERTSRRNIDDRLVAVDAAVDLLSENPARSMWGYGRSAWFDRIDIVAGEKLGVHNNYLAHIVFLGVVAGGMSILILYVLPTWRLITGRASPATRLLVYLSALGAFVSLNFYEGWFSPTLAVVLGTLWFTAHDPRIEDQSEASGDRGARLTGANAAAGSGGGVAPHGRPRRHQ